MNANAQVRLRLGNLFDGPSDLIILPCNTSGGVTPFVAQSLRSYDLPWPDSMPLGYSQIILLKGAGSIAQFAAFAASVQDGMTTPLSAIERIGAEIGSFCQEESAVRDVAAPLLGAGAGQLSSEQVVQSLRAGFTSKAPSDATLTISVLHRSVYQRIRKNLLGEGRTDRRELPISTRRVFFSYTDSGKGHIEWIIGIASFLRQNGINSRIDKWHLKPGMELPQWMCNELDLADKVVIVSDEAYAEKADGHLGGVGWETSKRNRDRQIILDMIRSLR